MREIKFRAWDKYGKIWLNNFAINSDGRFLRFDDTGIPNQSNIGALFEVMQFTGLFDKNGKEIYEGDIVNKLLYKYPRVVEWLRGGFGVSLGQYSGGLDKGIEIIGNIYENPELLK